MGLDRAGLALVLDHATTLAMAMAFFWLLVAVGAELLKRIGLPATEPGAELAFATTLGAGAVSTAILSACALFGVKPSVLAAVVVLAGLVSGRRLLPALALMKAAGHDLLHLSSHGWPRKCAAMGIGVVLLVLLLLGLAPGADWDSIAYHLTVPAAWLQSGRIHLPVDNYHTAFVGLNHMLYLPLLAVGATSGPSLINAFFALVAALLVVAGTRETFGRGAAQYAFWFFWASPILALVGASPRVDVTVALFLLSAHYAVILATTASKPAPLLLLAGGLLGMAFGVKYHAAAYAIFLLPLMLRVGNRRSSSRARGRVGLTGLACATALLMSSPWLIKNEVLFRAPVYPFLAAVRVEPWLAPFHGPGLTPVNVPSESFELLRHIRAPFNIADLVLRPERLAPDADAAGSRPNLALFLVPFALAVVPLRKGILWAGPAACYLAAILIVSPYTSLRYLIPAILPLTIVAASVFDYAAARLGRAGHALVVVAVLGTAVPSVVAVRRRIVESRPELVVAGLVSRRTYLHHYWETGAHIQASEWLNARLNADDTVLLLFEARGYFLRIPHRSDMLSRNWAFVNTPAGRLHCLREAGITHVLVNDHALNFFARRGANLSVIRWGEFEHFSARCLVLVHQGDGFRVYGVRAS